MTMINEEAIRVFLLNDTRRPLLTIKGIEEAAKIPEGNLSKFLRKKRPLPKVQIERLGQLLKCIGYGLTDDVLGLTPAAGNILPVWGNTLPIFNQEEADVEQTDEPGNVEPLPQDEGNPAPGKQPVEEVAVQSDADLWMEREEAVAKMSVYEQVAEREALREQIERDDFWEWINMPAYQTQQRIDSWIKTFKSRRMLTGLSVQIHFTAGVWEVKGSWRCYVKLIDDKGKTYRDRHNKEIVYKEKASQAFCERLQEGNGWVYTHQGENHFYTLPVGNPVIEPKSKPEKPKKVKPVKPAEKKSGFLMDLIGD